MCYTNKQARTARFFEPANHHAGPIVGITVIVVSVLGSLFSVIHRTFWSTGLPAAGLDVTMLSCHGIVALAYV